MEGQWTREELVKALDAGDTEKLEALRKANPLGFDLVRMQHDHDKLSGIVVRLVGVIEKHAEYFAEIGVETAISKTLLGESVSALAKTTAMVEKFGNQPAPIGRPVAKTLGIPGDRGRAQGAEEDMASRVQKLMEVGGITKEAGREVLLALAQESIKSL